MSLNDYFMSAALVLFISVFTFRTVLLRSRGVKVFLIGEGKSGFERLLEILFFILFPVWLAGFFVMAHTGDIFFLPAAVSVLLFEVVYLKTAGSMLAFLSVSIFVMALVAFRDSWRIGIDTGNPGKLVTGGIFSISRNPIFLSMYLFFAGAFFAYPNLFFLIFAVSVIIGMHIQILKEESFLESHYGVEYIDYMKRTGRYL